MLDAPHREAIVEQLELVSRAREGDHDAFAVLVDGALARLDAAARLIVRDTELARDAVQDAMLKAWRQLPTLREPERFDAWLHRLAMRACIDAARRRRRHVVEVALTPLTDPWVADDTAAVLDRDLLDRVLGRLEPEQRAILVLRYYLDLSLPDAADALGIPLGTAKSRLHRSLAAVRSSVAATESMPAARPEGRLA
jgi:RNA polymerase sigma-70 factor (ECF subfamily)